MWGFLTAGGNVPFVAALLLMILVGAVELLGLGGALSGDGDGDLFDWENPSILSWLNVGRLPLLMLIVVFLFSFGMIGVIAQRLLHAVAGFYAPVWISAPLGLAAALPLTRTFGRWVARIMPKDETTAVSRDSLVGRVAAIVTGEARHGNAAQARVRDEHGQVHYVMVEPDDEDSVFAQGDSVILVRMAGAKFYAIANNSPSLRDAIV
ncbi:MAG: hypothetical protein K0R83_2526 [Caulobacter sp.]|jgi:hypothetical protein|nr:hypothetical protein [Caulobacter sp.]